MLRNTGFIFLLLMMMCLTGSCTGGVTVDMSAPSAGLAVVELPVTASIPAAKTAAIVRSLETGGIVPSQIERDGGNLLVTWISRQSANGKGYSIEYVDKMSVGDARGVYLNQGKESVDVNINGRLFTRYVYSGAAKPYCWPIIGHTGKQMTRSFPMAAVEGEPKDHPHQKSLWFTFGNVNGIDFWTEGSRAGTVVHRSFDRLVSGPIYGRISTTNDWMSPDGDRVCQDKRDLRIYRTANGRYMDFEITIMATDGPVTFGDTKEGMFGIRVASSMDVDRGQGHIVNSRGQKDGATWGQQAEWCDYYGPVDGETVGITVMDNPSSFRYPTHWHVRTYGLFAANPFGLRDFTGDKTIDSGHTIPAGGEITFKYRIFIHKGTTDEAGIASIYDAYVGAPGWTLKQ